MQRREAVRLLGVIAAVPFLPQTVEAATELAERAHTAVRQGQRFRTLSPDEQALVARMADAILPRTDTPGALDVQVPEFIDHILTDWATVPERNAFKAGVEAIEHRARESGGARFTELADDRRNTLLRELDAQRGAGSGAGHAFGRIKSLTVYGYFTSPVVQRDVLKTQMAFATYTPCAPV